MPMTDLARRLFKLPPANLNKAIAGQGTVDLYTAGGALYDDAIHAARVGAYLTSRSRPSSHEDAVKASNKAAVRVAKVLGYSYPSTHTIQF